MGSSISNKSSGSEREDSKQERYIETDSGIIAQPTTSDSGRNFQKDYWKAV